MYETFYDISLDSMASHLQARSRTNIPEGAFYEEVHNPSTKGILKINLLTTKQEDWHSKNMKILGRK